MLHKLWNSFPTARFREGEIVAGKPCPDADGPAWYAVAYGKARPCPMCRQRGRYIREVRDGILRGEGAGRRFEETGRDLQCDCGIRWGDGEPAANPGQDAEEHG